MHVGITHIKQQLKPGGWVGKHRAVYLYRYIFENTNKIALV